MSLKSHGASSSCVSWNQQLGYIAPTNRRVEIKDLWTLLPVSTNTQALPVSRAAERMRLHRQRRRLGLRCIVIELRATEIDELVRRGFLTEDARNDRVAQRQAFYAFLDQSLTPTRWSVS